MSERDRLVLVVLEVANLDRSAKLYHDAFGIDLNESEHGGDDRWISGAHAAYSWHDGAYLHFALYQAKGEVTTGAQIGFSVADIADAHERAVIAGAQVVHEAREEPWGMTARYLDLDGNIVSLTQPS